MKTVGIIAEFNPFHKGHEYLIRTLKNETGSDYAVIVMSGDYTQRGAPAILDKYTRTKMALMCGADLVLELPVYYSTSSAEFFAGGAVSILNGIGVTDYLGFGSESGDINSMKKVANILTLEPPEFSFALKKALKSGMSYAAARALALSACLECGTDTISAPNDILGTEYIKALLIQNSSITPHAIKRLGDSYNEDSLPSDSGIFASAKAIRNELEREGLGISHAVNQFDHLSDDFPEKDAIAQLPDSVTKILSDLINTENCKFIKLDDFSELLHYKLLLEKNQGYEKYLDVSSDLSDKIVRCLPGYSSFSDFIMQLKSKDLTYTKINRALLHILLGMTTEKLSKYSNDRSHFTSYARILGFNKNASPLLKKIQECSHIPVISTLSDACKALDETAYELLESTITASNIYDMVLGKSKINEYAKAPVIVCSDRHRD